MKVNELLEAKGYEPNFKLLDATPTKPLTQAEVMAAMDELHDRIERQAEHYGGKVSLGVNKKTGKVDTSTHKFYPAFISKDIK